MRTLLENLREDERADALRGVKVAGRFVVNDLGQAIAEIVRLQARIACLRSETIEECAVAAEQQDRVGREWVRDSLWANILRRAGQNVRALNVPGHSPPR